jgi:hypothetical protein
MEESRIPLWDLNVAPRTKAEFALCEAEADYQLAVQRERRRLALEAMSPAEYQRARRKMRRYAKKAMRHANKQASAHAPHTPA